MGRCELVQSNINFVLQGSDATRKTLLPFYIQEKNPSLLGMPNGRINVQNNTVHPVLRIASKDF